MLSKIEVANLAFGMTLSEFKAALGEIFQTDSAKVVSRIYSSQRSLSQSEKVRFSRISDDAIVSTADIILGVVARF